MAASLPRPDAYLELRGCCPDSQFGLALSRAGDLNRDGYEDFAVGAPYEEGGGAVYVFLGAREGVAWAPRVGRMWQRAEQLASQVVRPQQVGGGTALHCTALSISLPSLSSCGTASPRPASPSPPWVAAWLVEKIWTVTDIQVRRGEGCGGLPASVVELL